MLSLKIAFRNIFRQRRRSILTALSMIIGFILLSVSLALSEGGYGNIIDLFTKSGTGHVQIHAKGYLERPGIYKNFPLSETLNRIVADEKNVAASAPRVFASALAFVEKKTTGARIIGIDPERERKTTTIEKKIDEGRFLKPAKDEEYGEAMIGRGMADILKAKLGSEIVLITQAADGSIANEIFRVVAILKEGANMADRNAVYLHLNKAQEFLALEGRVHEIAVLLESYKLSKQTASSIGENLRKNSFNDFEVDPWEVVEQEFYRSMEADKAGNYVMLVIISIIVAIGVLNTVLMSILERTREFGVMKAIGTRPVTIAKTVILETFILALISNSISIFLSIAANYPLVKYGITYPEPVSVGGITVSSIKSDLVAEAFTTPFIVVLLSAVIVSIIPAIRAAKTNPVDAMRTY